MADFSFDFSDTALGVSLAPAQPGGAVPLPGRFLIDSGKSERGWHRLESFLRCPRLYAYEEILHVEFRDKSALVRGSLVHVGLAHYYARRGAQQPNGVIYFEGEQQPDGKIQHVPQRMTDPERFYTPEYAVELAANRWHQEGSKEAMKLLPLCKHMVERYIAKWEGSSPDAFEVLGVEFPLRADIHGNLFTARADLGIKNRHGVYITDHKTAARPKGAVVHYTLSGQMAGLWHLGRMTWGNEFKGVMLNMVGAAEPYDMLRELAPSAPGVIQAFPQLVVDTEASIRALVASGRDPNLWPVAASEHVCSTRYGRCPAWELCRRGISVAPGATVP